MEQRPLSCSPGRKLPVSGGVTGLKPSQYSNFFQVQVTSDTGKVMPASQSWQRVPDRKLEQPSRQVGPPALALMANHCNSAKRVRSSGSVEPKALKKPS